jgi:hypothetical protein
MKRSQNLILALLLTVGMLLSACGGGGGGGDSSGTTQGTTQNPPPSTPSTPTTTAPQFSGFDFALEEGDFWEFKWDYEHDYVSMYGSSKTSDSATFRLTLGKAKQIGGVTAYEVILSGRSGGQSFDLTPRWKYLAVANQQILGSEDGATLVILFDAQLGKWPGSGFWDKYGEKILHVATNGNLKNDFYDGPAIVTGESYEKTQCQNFGGDIGSICGTDKDETLKRNEYYGEKIGPIGYYSYSALADPSANWWGSTEKNIGLVASSLRGNTVDYDLETEPNDSQSTAQKPTYLKILGEVKYQDPGTAVAVLAETLETEPNDSKTAAQQLTFPTRIKGKARDTDTGTNFQFYYNNVWNTVKGVDWYKFTILSPTKVNIELNFGGNTTEDLDLYLFKGAIVNPSYYSVNDNPTTKSFNEMIQKDLPADTYYIAVCADRTPAGAANYTLDVYTDKSGAPTIIEDWYSFTLTSRSTVTISMAFDGTNADLDLYLFSQGGTTPLASSRKGVGVQQESITATLDPGTYLVGVDLVNQWNSKYTLTIQ